MLPLLLNVPSTAEDWERYSFNIRSEIDRCNEAIQQQHGVSLPSYQLDPIDPGHVHDWVQNLSQALGGICGVLGIQSSDVLDVDLSNESARTGWIFSVFEELFAAEAALKI
jgi:hypothetical protein